MKAYKIIGTGIDIVENERMGEMLTRWDAKFKDKIFLPGEQEYCESKAAPSRHYAGRFAVKEAVSKATGTGIGEHIGWLDIEVKKDTASGAPEVRFTHKARALLSKLGADDVLMSLSHTHNYAVAHAMLVLRESQE